MDTVVFVLTVYTATSCWVPTLEFTSQAKCENAAKSFKTQVDKKSTWAKMIEPICVQVEK